MQTAIESSIEQASRPEVKSLYRRPPISTHSIFNDPLEGLLALGIFHTLFSLVVGLVGLSSRLAQFHNDRGIWNFAPDSSRYESSILYLSSILSGEGLGAWTQSPAWFHEKIYSIAYFLLGDSILSILLVNTTLYLITLALIYKLAATLFSETTALRSLWIIALLPSFLMQSTQLLRDNFVIPAQLAFLYGLIILMQDHSRRRDLWIGAAFMIVGYLGILRFKNYLIPFYLSIQLLSVATSFWLWLYKHLIYARQFFVLLFLLLGFAQQSQDAARYIPEPSILRSSMPATTAFTVDPRTLAFTERASPKPIRYRSPTQVSHETLIKLRITDWLNERIQPIVYWRDGFRRSYADSSSNIDTDITFANAADLVSYTPRALLIGLVAPFPSMWFDVGTHTGRIGRLIAGFEMLFMYLVIFFAGQCFWKHRNNLRLWPLGAYIFTGLLAHALIITNVGCLYRFRYIYWFLLIILAMRSLDDRPSFWRRTR